MAILRSRRLRGAPSAGGAGQLLWSLSAFASAGASDDIVIGSGDNILLDVDPVVGNVTITGSGKLEISRARDSVFTAASLDIDGGTYYAGIASDPWPATHTHGIVLTGARSDEVAGNLSSPASAVISKNRGIYVRNGGDFAMDAVVPATTIVKLAQTANAGASSVVLVSPVTWKAGDKIHFPSTDFLSVWPTTNPPVGLHDETRIVAADVNNNTTVTLTVPLTYRHHGALMYVVKRANEDLLYSNLSYTSNPILAGDVMGVVSGGNYLGQRVLDAYAAGAADHFDNRCTVGHLTRNLTIKGADDLDWSTHGYGATVMMMGLSSKMRLKGVGFERCGKAGQLGAYPIHWHMPSYTPWPAVGSGTYLGDVDTTTTYARYNTIQNSSNRGITLHGVCGALVEYNVIVNTDTHAIFMEDGPERRNMIRGNLVSRVNVIGYGKTPIKYHDQVIEARFYDPQSDTFFQQPNGYEGPACIWNTNPDNHIVDNILMGGYIGDWRNYATDYFSCYNVGGTRAGNGTIAFKTTSGYLGAGVSANENVTVTFTSATAFNMSGGWGTGVVGTEKTFGAGDIYSNQYHFTITAGGTPFVAGDTFTFQAKHFAGCFGASRDVAVTPARLPILEWKNNEMGCQGIRASELAGGVLDEAGRMSNNVNARFGLDPVSHSFDQAYMDLFENANIWKSGLDWHYNQALEVNYWKWKVCGIGKMQRDLGNDIDETLGIFGVTGGKFDGWLGSVDTLDNDLRSSASWTPTGALMTAYNGSVRLLNSVVLQGPTSDLINRSTGGFPYLMPKGMTTHATDFYNFSIEMKFRTNVNNAFLGEATGVHTWFPPPYFQMEACGVPLSTFNFATDSWALTNKGNAAYRRLPDDGSLFGMAGSWIYNHPFHTYGTTGGVEATGYHDWAHLNGVIVPSTYEYYSLRVYGLDTAGATDNNVLNLYAVNYQRYQSDRTSFVSGGTWNTPQTGPLIGYQNMRHAAILKGGGCDITWSRSDVPLASINALRLEIISMWNPDSHFWCSIDWNGVAVSTIHFGNRTFTAAASKAALFADITVNGYFVDVPNHKLWLNVYGNDGYTYGTDLDVHLVTLWSRSPHVLTINRTPDSP